jgi:beta-phosphoglucomutase-like phosphatase (HAD superfamily)
MKGLIFDLDGVLVNSMPTHYKAWKIAFDETTSLQVDERSIYLLEGMRGEDLVEEIFKNYSYTDLSKTKDVLLRKDEIFRSMMNVKPYDKVNEILRQLKCTKGIVSGSAKQDVVSIIDRCLQNDVINIVLTGDDIAQGKPNPEGFKLFLQRARLNPSDVLVIENAPLGVQASNNAAINPVVVLNNSPLRVNDFDNLIPIDQIYDETKNIGDKLLHGAMMSREGQISLLQPRQQDGIFAII